MPDGLGEFAVEIVFPEEEIDFSIEEDGEPGVVPGSVPDLYKGPLQVDVYVPPPVSCGDKCAEQDKLARQHCDMIRKRMAQWMKDSGCPSKIRGVKGKSKCRKNRRAGKAVSVSVKSR